MKVKSSRKNRRKKRTKMCLIIFLINPKRNVVLLSIENDAISILLEIKLRKRERERGSYEKKRRKKNKEYQDR